MDSHTRRDKKFNWTAKTIFLSEKLKKIKPGLPLLEDKEIGDGVVVCLDQILEYMEMEKAITNPIYH